MASKRKVQVSKTQLGELLRESQFDPRVDGSMKIIVDTAVTNPRYAEDRAIELIREAQQALAQLAPGPDDAIAAAYKYHRNMKNAISLLALGRALRS